MKKWLMGLICCAWAGMGSAGDILLFPTDAVLTTGVNDGGGKFIDFTDMGSSAIWTVTATSAGDYNLFAEVSCIGFRRGTIMDVLVDGQSIGSYKIPDTNNTFESQKLNEKTFALGAGTHALELRPLKPKGNSPTAKFRMMRISTSPELDGLVDSSFYIKGDSFASTMGSLRAGHPELVSPFLFRPVYAKLWRDYPHQMSWLTQDAVPVAEGRDNPKVDYMSSALAFFDANRDAGFEKMLINRVLTELAPADQKLVDAELKKLATVPASDTRWLDLYERAARVRRTQRLHPLLAKTDRVLFAKHQVFGSVSGIYNITETEGLNEGEVSELCSIDLSAEKTGHFAPVTKLMDAQGGMLRDPNLSYDGNRLLFAWRKTSEHQGTNQQAAPDSGNYQVYEMELATKAVRQLTTDETYGANYEAVYMPNGEILFNSARIVQHITCGWGDHSNLFLMDKDGKYQRQIGFDQVSTQFPTVLNNGQVIYLRRDYNDRGQSAAHALFVMNTDGTGQTEYYGNQTGCPNSFMHARAIPGSEKVVCVLSGYHTRQGGQLAIMDIRQGRNRGEGIVQIPQGTAPLYSAKPDDGYVKDQVQYANPYALSETEFIVSRSDTWAASRTYGGLGEHYAVYFMTADNRRELLAYDATTSCLQPVPVLKRANPTMRPAQTDYTKDTGTFYVQNVYLGAAAQGITNTVKKIRVVEVLYKHATVKTGDAWGPGGGTATVTPPAHPLALFDAKRIIGEATVYEDGSAMFNVPSRVPVYFQLLDEKNRCLQTMRSWSTLMPNERFSCVGCHEDKNETPVSSSRTMAMANGVEELTPFYGEPRGFSFMKEVQPVFDKHCVSCHQAGAKGKKLILTAEPFEDAPEMGRRFAQSYVQLMAARPGPNPANFRVMNGPKSWHRVGKAKADEPNKYVQYWGRLRGMEFEAPYFAGAIASGMIQKLDKGHAKVKLPQEDWDKLVAWIDLNCPYSGDYMEGNIWNKKEVQWYESRIEERNRNQAIEATAIQSFIQAGQPTQ